MHRIALFVALFAAVALASNHSMHTSGMDTDCSAQPECDKVCPPTVPVPLGQADVYYECDPAVNPMGNVCGNRCVYSDCDDKGVADTDIRAAACECHQMMDGRWHWMCLHSLCACPAPDAVEQHSICPMNGADMMNASFVGAYRVDSGTKGCRIDGQRDGCACSTAHDADDITDNWHWHCADDRIQSCGEVQAYSQTASSAPVVAVAASLTLLTMAAAL